jgi:glucose-1-phosphate cytidylyltransferase
MKVIILAGGYGTRLGSITEDMPKPMVGIGDKPMIWHIMNIYAQFGFKDFIIALGYKKEQIEDYFKNNIEPGWNVNLVDTGCDTLKGGRLKRLEKYLDDDINMLTYGDGLSNVNIDELIEFHKTHGKTLTITGVHPPARFGEIIEKDGKLISFKEKPQTSSSLISGGFFVFNKNLLGYLTEDEKCDLEYGVFDKLADQGEIMVYKHHTDWECVDTERDLKHLNKLWSENNAFWINIKK